MDQAHEQRLIRQAKRGEPEAFAALIREHQGRLFGFLYRLCRQRELAEDIVQEAFVRVLRNIERFDERYRFSTWLFTIARRLLVNALQKHRPRSESEWIDTWESRDVDLDQLVQGRESHTVLSTMLDEAMQVLSSTQREVVILYHHKGHGISEIANLLGMPAGTIKSHLHRARGRMREWLNGDATMRARVAELLGDAA